MIRTSLTLNISSQDFPQVSYLVNNTHLGLLSQSSQNIHIQTSHRPLQFFVSIRSEDSTSGSALTVQRQKINAWNNFFHILSKRGSSDLVSMLGQYHLQPEWLICLDEHRLQALFPEDTGFYLLRQDNLRRLRPISMKETSQPDENSVQARQYYSMPVALADQIFILPPALLDFFKPGEVTDILTGLRQLPARMGDLFNTARARGFSKEETWLAMQITHHEPDIVPGVRNRTDSKPAWGLFNFLRPGGFEQERPEPSSDSLSLSETDEDTGQQTKSTLIERYFSKYWVRLAAFAFVVIIIILILILLVSLLLPKGETEETTALTTTTTASTVLPSPTPTVRPTTTQTTTAALPRLIVIARKLNLREGDSREARLILTLEKGDILIQLAEPDGDWVKVRTSTGMVGYVFYSYVESHVEDDGS